MEKYDSKSEEAFIPRLPSNVTKDFSNFQKWHIFSTKSHILKSMCPKKDECVEGDPDCCEVCVYRYAVKIPHLPDMVFHNNSLHLEYENGAKLSFTPMDALKRVASENLGVQVSCSKEWQESRSKEHQEEKLKPFDWTFSTDYQGSINEKIIVEKTDLKIDRFKLMVKENILFYADITLFEDELHDHGISQLSVKIRVMPSGFYILLRFFLRVDEVIIKMNETRYYFENGKDYILKEFTSREATYQHLKDKAVPPAFFISPNDIADYLPVTQRTDEILKFE